MLDARETIIACRIKRGMTLKEVANLSGVNHVTIHYWETGRNEPTFFKIQCVLGAMGFELVLREKGNSNEQMD